MNYKSNEAYARIERDDTFIDKITKGYLGAVLTFSPMFLTVLSFWHRFVYQYFAAIYPDGKFFIVVVSIAIFTTATYFFCYLLYIKYGGAAPKEKCLECVDINVLDLILMQYDLITYARLLKIERELEKGDEVLIYTCSLDTEPYSIVRYNVEKKRIRYDILYYEGEFIADDKWLYRTDTKLKISEESFDSKLAHSNTNNTGCGFDLFIIKRRPRDGKDNMDIEGYYAVNYSTHSTNCQHKANGRCIAELQCDPDNKKLFYRKLNPSLASSIYSLLRRRVPEKSRVVRYFEKLRT